MKRRESDKDRVHGVLFTGGEAPIRPPIGLELTGAVIVAADSGVEHAIAWGVDPEVILGDMDSISDPSILDRFSGDRVKRFDAEKDFTDTELGLRELRRRGATEITIVGGGGGRLDHLLGIVALFDRDTPPRRWYTKGDQVECIEEELILTGVKGETLSLFPAGIGRCKMQSSGLKWPLDTLTWSKGDAGISNEVVSEECRIRVTQGRLIMVRSLPKVSR